MLCTYVVLDYTKYRISIFNLLHYVHLGGPYFNNFQNAVRATLKYLANICIHLTTLGYVD